LKAFHFTSRMASAAVAAALIFASAVSAHAECRLNSPGGAIKHVVYVEFDNVHFTRDNPSVPSDLEQMPNLLNFLKGKGTLDAGDHAVLISHTANDILTTQTGLYSDRDGISVANSFDVFGMANPNNIFGVSSFFYWTDLVSDINTSSDDHTFAMVTDTGLNTPAPWVPFTRAGCDVGAFSTANIVLERAPFDVTKVFGAGSPPTMESGNNQNTDFIGEAIHCAAGSSLCTMGNGAVNDLLPGEPGGYAGFSALFGAKFVAPALLGTGNVFHDLDGNLITNGATNTAGFPGFSPLATQTLGAVAAMLEHNVPIVFAYIADAHDDQEGINGGNAFGPGQPGYVKQLHDYDVAFGKFFARLKGDGIDESNTLFVFTPDEGDHYAGAGPTNPGCDGVTTQCVYAPNTIGELDIGLKGLVAAGGAITSFSIHSDDAPTIYVQGQPGRTAPPVRTLARVMGGLTAMNPITHNTDHLTAALADPVEEAMLHMVVASDPLRTPTLTMFGDPDYFFLPTFSTTPTVGAGFAWNHGDIQPEIARTFIGIVGPGVQNLGVTSAFFTDHVDVRPTIMSLVGLTDDYEHDGRVITEMLETKATPQALVAHRATALALGQAYKAIDAPFGALAMATLKLSTFGLESNDVNDVTYTQIESEIETWTAQRNTIASQMRDILEAAAFDGQSLDEGAAKSLIDQANALVNAANAAAAAI
jgi:hypothetical protein